MKKVQIKGYDDIYFIDASACVYDENGRKVSVKEYSNKYLYVTFKKKGEEVNRLIHILVAKAFIPNPKRRKLVNHKDLNRQNNNVSNLEWVTHIMNSRHHIEMRKGGKINI